MAILTSVLYILLFLISIFLILLVLIQRGRGGGLAGALGGMGGYSAFGTRAGDLFTKITIGTAAVWILCAMALAKINVSNPPTYQNKGAPVESRQNPLSGDSADRTDGDGSKSNDLEKPAGKPLISSPEKKSPPTTTSDPDAP